MQFNWVDTEVPKSKTTDTSKYYICIYVYRYTIRLYGSLTFRDFGIDPFNLQACRMSSAGKRWWWIDDVVDRFASEKGYLILGVS